MLHLVLLVAILSYTVPASQDTLCGESDGLPTEHMGTVQVWTKVVGQMSWRVRTKNVAGMEGQRDTIQVPDDNFATVFLRPVDRARHLGCAGNQFAIAPHLNTTESVAIPARRRRSHPSDAV